MDCRGGEARAAAWARGLWRAGLLGCALSILGAWSPGLAAEGKGAKVEKKSPDAPRSPGKAGGDLDGWGRLGSLVTGTKDLYKLTLYQKNKKGQLESVKTLVQIPGDAELCVDQSIRLEDLVAGEPVWILGRNMTYDIPSRRGGGLGGTSSGKDRQLQNAQVLLAGKEIQVNQQYRDPKDSSVKWHRATVTKSTGGLSVESEGEKFRVTLEPSAPILRRSECDRKLVKSGAYVYVAGKQTALPPDMNKKTVTESTAYKSRRVVVLDARYVKTVYAAVFP